MSLRQLTDFYAIPRPLCQNCVSRKIWQTGFSGLLPRPGTRSQGKREARERKGRGVFLRGGRNFKPAARAAAWRASWLRLLADEPTDGAPRGGGT